MKRSAKFTLLAAVLATAGAATAFAAKSSENDALAISQAKTSLTQAIAAAEQKVGGKATKAEFEESKQHGWVYEVEVVSGPKVFDVKVDAQAGTVIASTEDKPDRDSDKDDDGQD
jgi:uncharacterized membrane protein YkoI